MANQIITANQVNTGNLIQPGKKKISVPGGFPLDKNNQRTDGLNGSGLPQDTMENPPYAPDYKVPNPGRCPVPGPIPINLQLVWGTNPYTWVGASVYVNEVLRETYIASGSYSVPGANNSGDTIRVQEFSLAASFPWAPSSRADVTIKKDNATVKATGSSVNQATGFSTSWLSEVNSLSVDILVMGSSTATGFVTYEANITSPFADGEVGVMLNDNTNAALRLNVAPNSGSSGVPFNVLNDASTMTGKISNDSDEVMHYVLTGIGGYSKNGNIEPGEDFTIADIPKGNISLTSSVAVDLPIEFYYDVTWGNNPYQEASFDIERDDVLIIQQTAQEGSNDFNNVFTKGQKIDIIHTTIPARYPWETLSGSRLRVVKNGTTVIFNNLITAQVNPLQICTINTDNTFNRIDMYITGESTKPGMITRLLRPYIFFSEDGYFELAVVDNTTSEEKLKVVPGTGGDRFKVNMVNDANTLTLKVKNTDISDKKIYIESGVGFTYAGTVSAGTTLDVPGLLKDGDIYFFDVEEIGYIHKADFVRNNCTGGQVGGTVPYVKGYVDSAASAADNANFNTQGQARANSLGTCTA